MRKRWLAPVTLVPLLPLLACGPSPAFEDEVQATQAPLLDISRPPAGVPATGPLPVASLSAVPLSTSAGTTSVRALRRGRFSNGADVPNPGLDAVTTDIGAVTAGPFSTWVDGVTAAPFTAPAALDDRLRVGLSFARERARVRTDAIGWGVWSLASAPAITEKLNGFSPVRARWMKSETLTGPAGPATFNYADPQLYREVRHRSARLYCASREAQRAQAATNAYSMGSQALVTFDLFGAQIQLMNVEPTFAFDTPEDHRDAPVDGAQVFSIPTLVGSRITPISIAPSLPELRSPLVIVSGDGELTNADGVGTRTFQTASHADAFLSREANREVQLPDITLFSLGVADVKLKIGARATVGRLTASDDRVLGHASGARPFTRVPRPFAETTSLVGASYFDGPLQLGSGTPAFPSPVPLPGAGFVGLSQLRPIGASGPVGLATTNPMLARLLSDDDHAVEVEHSVGLTTALAVSVGPDLGFIKLEVTATGGITASGGQVQAVRDGVSFLSSSQGPAALLSVTPRLFASADFRLDVRFTVRVGPFPFSVTLLDVRQPLARFDGAPFPELQRMRVGTSDGAEVADLLRAPGVRSHVPEVSTLFQSFPPGRDVDACLADLSDPTAPPPPCSSTPPTFIPPRVNICMEFVRPTVGPTIPVFPRLLCSDPAEYLTRLPGSLTPEQRSCIQNALVFFCEPTSQVLGDDSISRVLISSALSPAATSALGIRLESVINTCVAPAAFGPDAARTLFRAAPCNAEAKIFGRDNTPIFSVTGPGPIRSGTCNR